MDAELKEHPEDGKSLSDTEEMQEPRTSHHFSIRGYVSEIRKIDKNICWPFNKIDDHNQSKELSDLLPPMILPRFRWWGCKSCLCEFNKIESTAGNVESLDKNHVTDLHIHEPASLVKDKEGTGRDSIIPITSEKDDHMSKDPLYAEHQDGNIQRTNLGYGPFEIDHDSNGRDAVVQRDNLLRTDSSSERIFEPDVEEVEVGKSDGDQISSQADCQSYSTQPGSSRKRRKLRTMADILKSDPSSLSRDEVMQMREGTDNLENGLLKDEKPGTHYKRVKAGTRGKKKFPSRGRWYFSKGEGEVPSSLRLSLKRSKNPNQANFSSEICFYPRVKKLNDVEDISANIIEDKRNADCSHAVPQCETPHLDQEQMVPHDINHGPSFSVNCPKDSSQLMSEKQSIQREMGKSKPHEVGKSMQSELGSSVPALCREEKAAAPPVHGKQTIVDDIPIEILQLLQSNFHRNHQQNSGHSTADVACSSEINNETTDVGLTQRGAMPKRFSKFGQEALSTNPGMPPRTPQRRKRPFEARFGSNPVQYAKNSSLTVGLLRNIAHHHNSREMPIPYQCRCFSRGNSFPGLFPEMGYECSPSESLSAMNLLRLMDPAVSVNNIPAGRTSSSFNHKQQGNYCSREFIDATSFNSAATYSRERSRPSFSSIQLGNKKNDAADGSLRGDKTELGYCALNMNPADFFTVDGRSNLYMMSYKDLNPREKPPKRKKEFSCREV